MKVFLSDCHKVETLAATIYGRLSREATYAPWLCEAFRALAAEEREHAQHIDMVAQATEAALDALPALSGTVIEATVRTAEEMAARLERGPIPEVEALRLAVQMEKRFALVHVEQSVFSYNPRLTELFEKLRNGDQSHIDRLKACLDRWQAEHPTRPPGDA